MAIDFEGLTYTTPDGAFSVPLSSFPAVTWVNMATRILDHATGNEVASIITGLQKKNGADFTEAERAAHKLAERTKFVQDMIDGKWGEKSRGPRMPAENRLEAIVNLFLADETRKNVASKKEFKAVEGKKDVWVVVANGNEFNLAQAMAAYRNNPDLGTQRMESINRRAQAKYEAELKDAAERKAAKEREAGATVTSADGELVL